MTNATAEKPVAAQAFTCAGKGVKRAMHPAPAKKTMASITSVKSRAERNDIVCDCSTGGGRVLNLRARWFRLPRRFKL